MIKQVSKATAMSILTVAAIYGIADFGGKVADKIEHAGEKQYVAFNKKQFTKPDFQSQSRLMAMGGIDGISPMDTINGFSFRGSESDFNRLKSGAGEEWEIQEERVYKIDGCTREPEQTPIPFPTGIPTTRPSTGPTPIATNPPTSGDIVPWGIDKVQSLAANRITDGKDITVCITDTGADMQHPDLREQIIGGESFVPGVSWADDQGHGTHVAGTISAKANGTDVIGVSQSKLYIVKVLDRAGQGMSSWIANGVVACANSGAQIISMSLGSPAQYGPDPVITQAINYAISKGVKVVAAAGNDSGPVGYPAALSGVIAVGATDQFDNYAVFSSRGPEIDYLAPGLNILSARMGGGTTTMSGTSMATPHVSAALALALSRGRNVIATDPVNLPYSGRGRINALKTVQ